MLKGISICIVTICIMTSGYVMSVTKLEKRPLELINAKASTDLDQLIKIYKNPIVKKIKSLDTKS